MQKKNKNSLEHTKDNKLSTQFSLDGFSFCTINNENVVSYFNRIEFENTLNSAEELLQKIKSVFKTDQALQTDFNEILVIHENNLSTLVPNEFFNENNLKTYLDFNIKTLSTDYFTFDSIKKTTINNVYIPYININNYLFQHFGTFEYKHHLTVLIEKLLLLEVEKSSKIYVNVSESYLDIIYFENNNLRFANTFNYNTEEDFAYYILFVLEQLNLDTNIINLVLFGDIYEESEIFKMLYLYIKNITFLKSNSYIYDTLDYENHTNYILLG